MTPVKLERGRYRVMRMCCAIGHCGICRGLWRKDRRKRIIVLDRLSEQSARDIANNWRSHDAVVERMP